jgi:hypothetical protein
MIRIKELLTEAPKSKLPTDPYDWKKNPLTKKTGDMVASTQKAKEIAKEIYDAKGFFEDDEYKAVLAIEQIPDLETFNYVQKFLQELTGGRGIGQYVTSFIDLAYVKWSDENPIKISPQRLNQTNRLIDAIVDHLVKIKAPAITINIFNDYKQEMVQRIRRDRHTLMEVAQVVSYLIPIPFAGKIASVLIGLEDANMYRQEGDMYTAGFIAALSLTPGIGKLLEKLGAKKLLASLAKKAISKTPYLSKSEQAVSKYILTQKQAIRSKLVKEMVRGVKSGRINPNAIRSLWWIQPVGRGTFKLAYGGLKYFVVPAVTYDRLYRSDPVQKLLQPSDEELRQSGEDYLNYKLGNIE